MYIVLIGDIINSKESSLNIELVIKNLNELNISSKVTQFSYYAGDEIQILFEFNADIVSIIRKIRYSLFPLKLRIGLGIGDVDAIKGNNSYKLNGEAFYKARNAIESIKKLKSDSTKLSSDFKLLDLSFNTIMLIYDEIISSWSEKQFEAIMLYEKNGTYKEVANILNISINGVRKRLVSSKWQIINEVEYNLKAIFNEFGGV